MEIPEEIEKWFLSQAIYDRENEGSVPRNENIQEKDKYQWSWFLFDIVEEGDILEANGIDFLKFSFAGNCRVEVKLKEVGNHVVVELSQGNIPTDDKSKKGIRLGCDSGWSFFLLNLKFFKDFLLYFNHLHSLKNLIINQVKRYL